MFPLHLKSASLYVYISSRLLSGAPCLLPTYILHCLESASQHGFYKGRSRCQKLCAAGFISVKCTEDCSTAWMLIASQNVVKAWKQAVGAVWLECGAREGDCCSCCTSRSQWIFAHGGRGNHSGPWQRTGELLAWSGIWKNNIFGLEVTSAVFYLFEGRSLKLYPKNTFKHYLIPSRL